MPFNRISKYAELTDSHYSSIGKVIIEWSNIEFCLNLLLTRLTKTPDFLGQIYTYEMNMSRVLSALRTAVDVNRRRYYSHFVSSQVLDEIESLIGHVDKLRLQRNKIVHYCWMRSTDEEIFGVRFTGKVPTRDKPKRDYMTLTLDELDEMFRQSRLLVEQMQNLIDKVPEIDEIKT